MLVGGKGGGAVLSLKPQRKFPVGCSGARVRAAWTVDNAPQRPGQFSQSRKSPPASHPLPALGALARAISLPLLTRFERCESKGGLSAPWKNSMYWEVCVLPGAVGNPGPRGNPCCQACAPLRGLGVRLPKPSTAEVLRPS